MSVHKRGRSYQVKYRDENGQQRSKTFGRKGDADAFDERVTRIKRLGPELARQIIDRPQTMTLGAFVVAGFRTHIAPRPRKTREQYKWALDLHLQELLDVPLYALDVPALSAHQTKLSENGRTAHTTRTVMTLLGGILQVAVEHGLLPANPVRSLRKLPADAKDEIVPLAPAELEALIATFAARSRIICVLAGHLGLSPVEVRMAPWSAWRGDKFTVSAANTKKQRARSRVLDVPLATQHELRHWRMESGAGNTPHDPRPIIGDMTVYALKQWGTRTLKPVIADVAGLDGSLYTLRHSHASALHYCGFTLPSAAKRMGHGQALHLQHYAHVIESLEGQPRYENLDALITAARNDAGREATG